MAFDESKFPTLKFVRCRKCKNLFTTNLSGAPECPDCASADTTGFQPDEKKDDGVDNSES
jgi:Zn finger protein HypA/HybF involved in hydrogenase expression